MTENQPSTSADGEKTPAASLGRPVHFEIQAADVERATAFYREVFSWSMQDWSEYAGMPYVGVSTGRASASTAPSSGGTEALPKYALPGMAWQAYFHDTEHNVFGLHQPDPEAR